MKSIKKLSLYKMEKEAYTSIITVKSPTTHYF